MTATFTTAPDWPQTINGRQLMVTDYADGGPLVAAVRGDDGDTWGRPVDLPPVALVPDVLGEVAL